MWTVFVQWQRFPHLSSKQKIISQVKIPMKLAVIKFQTGTQVDKLWCSLMMKNINFIFSRFIAHEEKHLKAFGLNLAHSS